MRRVARGAFASSVLHAGLDGLSSQDRGFITDLVYGTLRNHRYLDACLAPHLKRPDKLPEDIYNALRLGAFELLIRGTPRRAATNEWVGIVKKKYGRLAGLVNAVLRKLEPNGALPPPVKLSVPDALFDDWQTLFGDEAEAIAKALLEPEPLWLTSYHPEAAQSLEAEGCRVSPGPLSNTLAVQPSQPLATLSAYKKGWVQPQNPSSTVPVRLLEPQKGERVLDLASGNGVKAAQLAQAGAKVVSVELEPKKLERAEANLKRLGLKAESLAHDLRSVPKLEPANKVLLDAPCSGTGTLRGHPEIKGRLNAQALKSLSTLQSALLSTAAALTAPGGTLVYAVCALTPGESLDVVRHFLEAKPGFKLEPFELPVANEMTEYGSFILPLDGLDGFFIARFRKGEADAGSALR